jgi:hypothetical protein
VFCVGQGQEALSQTAPPQAAEKSGFVSGHRFSDAATGFIINGPF